MRIRPRGAGAGAGGAGSFWSGGGGGGALEGDVEELFFVGGGGVCVAAFWGLGVWGVSYVVRLRGRKG